MIVCCTPHTQTRLTQNVRFQYDSSEIDAEIAQLQELAESQMKEITMKQVIKYQLAGVYEMILLK